MTYTNSKSQMIAFDEAVKGVECMKSGGLCLFPTDTVWSIGCPLQDELSLYQMMKLKENSSPYSIEILVDSIQMLKELIPNLHPKLETLLVYHQHPLSVVVDNKCLPLGIQNRFGLKTVVRLVHDPFTRDMLQLLQAPVASTFATQFDQTVPTSFGTVSSAILEKMDFVVRYRQKERKRHLPSVMVQLSEKAELVFLRE
ncbi:MAG: Sua5/YciO/YrdC/YwlC family protein [Bacteroidota bacterium]